MKYRVDEWVYVNPAWNCENSAVEEITEAMKQAIVNDIRKNGYIFDPRCDMAPLLNTGEYVNLSYDLCTELVCRAFGFDEDTYNDYLSRVPKEPETSKASVYEPELLTHKVVTVNDDAFDDLCLALRSGEYNLELFPSGRMLPQVGSVVRFITDSKEKYVDVTVKTYFYGLVLDASAIKAIEKTDIEDLLRLLNIDEAFNGEELPKYRYAGLSGQEIYSAYKRDYETWWHAMISGEDSNLMVDAVIYEVRDTPLEHAVLDAPEDIPLSADVMDEINAKYEQSIAEEKAHREESRRKYLALKEKMAKRKSEEAKKKTPEEQTPEEPAPEEQKEVNPEKIPFITLDNIGNYNFGSEDKEDSVDEMIEKARREHALARKNPSLEKSIMLLNNACIYFDKILAAGSRVPADLFFTVKSDQLKALVVTGDTDGADRVFDETVEYYSALDGEEREHNVIPYCNILLDCIFHFCRSGEFEKLSVSVNTVFELLESNDSDDALKIKATCFSSLGQLYFESKDYDRAIDYSYNALMTMKEVKDKTPEVYNRYATLAFNLGNVYFQSDKYENAETLFKFTLDFCRDNEFDGNMNIMQYAANYLSQVYVCMENYSDAIEGYLSHVSYSHENFSGDEALGTEAEFLYRVALIYHKFLHDDENAVKYSEQAKERLSALEDQYSDRAMDLNYGLEKLFKS